MMIRAIPGKSPAGRVAVIISKKVFKSAVKRNRVRRRIYNIVRHELCKHNPVATDMVITVFSQDVLVMEHALLQRELSYLVASSITRDRRA